MKSAPTRGPAPRASDKLPTRIPGLDTLLNGGIPVGRATLVAGRSGTFKTILSLQVALSTARHGGRALFISTEQETADLLKVAGSLGLDARELVESGRLRLMDLTIGADDPVRISGTYDVAGLIYRISSLVRESKAQLVVLDSVSALFALLPPSTPVRGEFFQLVRALRRMRVTALLTAESESDYAPLTRLGVEEHVCDLVLVLRNAMDGKRRRRSIEVHKYRTSSHFKGEYPWTLGDGGLSVFPVESEERPAEASDDRYPSGLAGLDEMTGGGWMRNSIVLARGLSGSGKTTLGGMLALACAERGERVIYYGFEETQPILLRNFRALGMPLERHVRKGTLKIICRYPEATSPEDMVIEVREMLERYAPTLLVLDSLSSIEHVASAEGFRHFLLGLTASLRRHGRSALLLQTVGHDHEVAPYLSTLADAILLLGYAPRPEGLERWIQLLKMRGSAHDTRERPLTIGHGGLRVGAPSV